MYLFDNKDCNYYEIMDEKAFLAGLDDQDFKNIKYIFKMTYQEHLLQSSLKILRDAGYVELNGEPVDLSDTISMFKEYIIYRYGETAYNMMIVSFEADYDYRLKTIANPSMLN